LKELTRNFCHSPCPLANQCTFEYSLLWCTLTICLTESDIYS
jgi:hypothetical protein